MNIGLGVKNSYNKELGTKLNGEKKDLKASEEIQVTEEKLSKGMSVDDLSEKEYKALVALGQAEHSAALAEAFKEISRAEKIAQKYARGEELTEEEKKLLDEKYVHLKREAEQAKKESEELRDRVRSAKTKEEKQELIMTALSNVGDLLNKNAITPAQAKIKIASIEKVREEEGNKNAIGKDLKVKNMEPGLFINKKM